MTLSSTLPYRPRTLVEDRASKMELRGRQARPGSLPLLLLPDGYRRARSGDSSAELSLSLGNRRAEGRTMVGNRAVATCSRPGQTRQFSHLSQGNDISPSPTDTVLRK